MQAARLRGSASEVRGRMAEHAVADGYLRRKACLLARRARTPAGEVDLIFRDGTDTVFVEVKSARTLADAAHALRPAQIRRLGAAAEAWMAESGNPGGTVRFDVALVDGQGRIEILENALGFDA
jgi:putative endonuclease